MQFPDPLVIDGMACLYVVIAERLGIVFQIVDNLSGNVRTVGLHVVGVVARRLTLQDVAVLQQDEVSAIAATLLFDV